MTSDHEKETVGKVQSSVLRSRVHSPTIFSPLISPKTSPKVVLSPKPDTAAFAVRLLSVKITDSAVATSLPASPGMSNDYSISSADSDVEVIVWLKLYVHIYTKSQHAWFNSLYICSSSIYENAGILFLFFTEKLFVIRRPPKVAGKSIVEHLA